MDKPDSNNILPVVHLEVIKDDYREDAKEAFPQIVPVERASQQAILPAAVKRRNTVIEFEQSPDPSLTNEPFWVTATPVATGRSQTFNWVTASGGVGQEIFAQSLMSFYFSPTPYGDFRTFSQNNEQWPNGTYNMTNIPCSFWQDEARSTPTSVSSRQSFYNNTGTTVFAMATLRTRILSNSNAVGTS